MIDQTVVKVKNIKEPVNLIYAGRHDSVKQHFDWCIANSLMMKAVPFYCLHAYA